MPIISFSVMLAGGIAVWAGYLGQSIPTVTKAILNGQTKTLTKIPLDPDKRPGAAPVTSDGDGGSSQSSGGGAGGGGGSSF
jgi:uncharacterized membrane protein YgcG